MTEMKEKVPAYEALESKIDELDQLAALCSRMFDGCVDAYVSESETVRIAKDAGLHYVYPGNVPGTRSDSTFCYDCGRVLIERLGYQKE